MIFSDDHLSDDLLSDDLLSDDPLSDDLLSDDLLSDDLLTWHGGELKSLVLTVFFILGAPWTFFGLLNFIWNQKRHFLGDHTSNILWSKLHNLKYGPMAKVFGGTKTNLTINFSPSVFWNYPVVNLQLCCV